MNSEHKQRSKVVFYNTKNTGRKKPGVVESAKTGFRKFSPTIKPILVISTIIVLLFSLFNFLLHSKFLTVTKININSKNGFYLVDLSELRRLTEENLLGKNLLSVDVYEMSDILTRNFLGIRHLVITKNYNGVVDILIEERIPIGIITKNSENFIVDAGGYVIGAVSEEYINRTDSLRTLPRISYNSEVKIGTNIDKNIIPAYLELYQNIEKNNIKASSVSFNSYYMELNLESGVKLLVGTDKSITKSLEYVLNLIRQLSVEGKNIKKIDLRYDKVIVEY